MGTRLIPWCGHVFIGYRASIEPDVMGMIFGKDHRPTDKISILYSLERAREIERESVRECACLLYLEYELAYTRQRSSTPQSILIFSVRPSCFLLLSRYLEPGRIIAACLSDHAIIRMQIY